MNFFKWGLSEFTLFKIFFHCFFRGLQFLRNLWQLRIKIFSGFIISLFRLFLNFNPPKTYDSPLKFRPLTTKIHRAFFPSVSTFGLRKTFRKSFTPHREKFKAQLPDIYDLFPPLISPTGYLTTTWCINKHPHRHKSTSCWLAGVHEYFQSKHQRDSVDYCVR